MEIKKFIENKDIREITLTKQPYNFETKIFKISFGRFDYVYVIEYIENKKPRRNDNVNFGGIIDTQTNKLYFATYYLKSYCQDINIITENQINDEYNEMLQTAYKNFADTVADDQVPTEDEIASAKSEAETDYYHKRSFVTTIAYGVTASRDINELIAFVENPKQTIKNYIEMLEAKDQTLTKAIKYRKMMQRLQNENFDKILNNPEYKTLRTARKILDSLPENAKSVTIYYRLSNNELLEAKMETIAFGYKPYSSNENMHFSNYSINSEARHKLKIVDGYSRNDIYINNIEKITYKAKTIYEKEKD